MFALRQHQQHLRRFQKLCNRQHPNSSSKPSALLSSSSHLSYYDDNTSRKNQRHFSSSSPRKTFDKVLVANRGEIACRVLRTCRNLGIETVAIYSPADGPNSLHARMADECFMIGSGGSSSAADSYLRGEEVIDIALRSGAQAIHPGYGFLSENANFAKMIQQQQSSSGLTFVGPSPSAILSMGDKSHSKDIMENANVCTTPGYHGSNQDPEYLLHEAVHNVGFPLLIKATHGGGGKGMRLVHSEKDFLSALESCQREALNSFGDSNVILEKYLVDPRHVEVQIVADSHGNCLYLHERDCSLQRRHQKILEEAPASYLSSSMREQMGEMAVKAAKAVEYVNAGTVEFLYDAPSDEFYFCEMNTRLQVEHPITELITGIDLVEWQLRIAAGGALPMTQEDVPCIGHAMEARIYAENTKKGFIPAVGKVWHHSPPVKPNVGSVPVEYEDTATTKGGCVARVDTGLQANDVLTVHYDPMISKLIVHAPSRLEAITTLQKSLDKYHLAGIPNNISFLQDCLNHETFRIAGGVDTGFLEREEAYFLRKNRIGGMEDEWHVDMLEQSPLSVAIGVFGVMMKIDDRVGVAHSKGPWSNASGSWRMGGSEGRFRRHLVPLFPEGVDFSSSSSKIECASNRDGSYEISITTPAGRSVYTINGTFSPDGKMNVFVDGTKRMSFVAFTNEEEDKSSFDISLWSSSGTSSSDTYSAWNMTFRHPLPAFASSYRDSDNMLDGDATGGRKRSVKSPMPGKIIRVNAKEGDEVKDGDVLLVMEAMKMEHVVRSPLDGIVGTLELNVGDIVEDGSILAVIDDDIDSRKDDEEIESSA
uniref:Acetyl-CoA carboxylase n=2 Tax=Helicotheca tamesis TaxID=374047 RepID=A0A7S2MXT5_9STRA|mmetsp:Transcript_5412/g.7442  ORF Transcript_5412/g.7442 Transcript_5412/m.7442 type:complete len:821 (+) Transcript_5412:213-2675(+)|eukprot:CAMPEP_0185730926 /NCGR_PEP_ID=MMETSP1171-20130828/11417_1 /TAXON_ID=374046 /ORGANISM="Helicotheca tamensis, Strain CCMP826" /LENGTH=820 /DNA_ID=CAMNT_0028400077 /DNA_START=174 /DNA_END=2636 /DNA_ORIENTATION=+